MESRIYEERFKEIRDSIFSLLKLKNAKALEYEKRAISEYIDRLSKGDFQIRSFKSKVAYFSNQKEKYLNEVSEAINASSKKIKEFLDQVMVQMEAEKDSLEIQERRNDLLEINQDVKHKRQDNANRMTALDREYQTKIKDASNDLQDKEKLLSSYQIDASKKLSIDLLKIKDSYNKKTLPLEKSLLEIDEKKKISEVRTKINELRKEMLSSEFKLRVDHQKKVKDDLTKLLNEVRESTLALEANKNEYQIKKIENSRSNDFLSLESENNIFHYDLDKRDKGFDLICEIYNQKVEYFNSIRDQKRNVYAREMNLKKKYNDKLFLFASLNAIHPFLNLINYILKEYEEYANYFNDVIASQNQIRFDYLNQTSEMVQNLNLMLFNGKAKNRRMLDDSVRKCVVSLFDSDLLNNEYNQVIDFFDKILNIFNTKNNELDKKDEFLNNIFVYERTINRYDAKEKFDNDMAYISNEFKKYQDQYKVKRENDIKSFDKLMEEKNVEVEKKFKSNLDKIREDYEILEATLNDKLQKDIEIINKDYNKNVNSEEKLYKNRLQTL